MKTNKSFIFATVILLVAYLLSACGSAPQLAGGSPDEQSTLKVRASATAYTGVIEDMNGSQWTVNSQVLSVAPEVVSDGPFQVGDTIKIEANVEQDGTITVLSVRAPSASDLANLPQLGDDNSNDNSNDANDNDSNDNDDANGNDNDDDGNDNDNDDNGNDNDDDGNDNDNDDNGNDNDDDDNGNDNDDDDDDDDHDDDDDD